MACRRSLEIALAASLIEATLTVAVCAMPEDAANVLVFSCRGRLEFGRTFLSSEAQPSLEFEVSVRFGEGEILALVDPETSRVKTVLYDAEVKSGSLRFKDGDEKRVVWTRLSGATGPLVGEALASDRDVIALSVDRQAPDGGRPFALFAAAGGRAYRGDCRARHGPNNS